MELPAHFEELMNRSPISQADITSFLRDMRRTPSGTLVISKLLAGKIQSSSEAQAIQAFDVLEAALDSETEGSIEFRTEIGRYRFLNEIIRILSPKYMGDNTLPAVKERAVQFLNDAAGSKRKRWFPSEHSKIQAVYQSLIDGGVIKKSSKFPSTEADEEAELQKSIFDRAENAAILKKLLTSRDPSDLQAANRLIKNLVEEESKRIERRAELHSLIDRIETSTSLLVEMLSQRQIDKEIVDELADTCKSLRQKLGGVATETNDETTSLLQASENLEKALELYEERKDFQGVDDSGDSSPEEGATGGIGNPTKSLTLADELLMGLDLHNISEDATKDQTKTLQLLSSLTGAKDGGDNLLNLDIDLSDRLTQALSSPLASTSDFKEKGNLALDEIGRLSRELMEQSLMGKSVSNPTPEFKKTDKTPLSQLKKPSAEKTSTPDLRSTSITTPQAQPVDLFDLGFFETANNGATSGAHLTSSSKSKVPTVNENLLLVLHDNENKGPSDMASVSTNNFETGTKPSNTNSESSNNSSAEEVKLLLNSTKEIDLDKVDMIENLKPLDLDIGESSKDVNLTLVFGTCADFPSSVKIAIVTLTNKSSSELINFVFQLLPPKGLQIKLLPPGTMELPPWKKSFLPPPMLTQVALMAVPKGYQSNSILTSQQKMRYILSYTSNDDTALHNGDFEIPVCLLK